MQKIKNSLKNLRKNRLYINLGITLFETVSTKGINFLIILLLTRFLGPEDYGKYSFIFVSMMFFAALFDFGMENTAVRFSAKKKDLSNSVFGLYFLTKLVILFSVVLVLGIFGRDIFVALNKEEIAEYIPFLILGLIGESLYFVNDTYLQALQKFQLRAIINISRYITSFTYILILFTNHILLLKYVFYLYFIPLVITCLFIGRYINFVKSFFTNKIEKNLLVDIWNYEKWMISLSIGNNILTRIDFFMLSFWVKFDQIGIYNAAFQLASIVAFLPFVLGKVLLPQMSELKPDRVFVDIKHIIKMTFIASTAIACFIPAFTYLVPILLGNEYQQASSILLILLFAFIVSLLTVPFEQALYSIGKPKFISMTKYIQILSIIILNVLTIPNFGIIWAAINVLIARLITIGILVFIFIKQEKKFAMPKEESFNVYEGLYGQTD